MIAIKTLRLTLVAALCVVSSLAVPPTAHAQRIVFDPTNYVQNVLTAARTLEQINNQIRQLQNEAMMLVNQARNLTRLDFSVVVELQAALAATNQLIQQAQGLAFSVSRMESDFRRLYPESYGAAIPGLQMVLDTQTRWRNSLEALRTATQMQAQAVQNFPSDERALADLVSRSQSAVGALQAMQATNQLLALQARQTIQGQQLQLTQDRAAALEQARQVAVHERAREVRRRFLGEGTPYTPQAVEFYSR